jgi:hypothetical protein
MTSARICQQLKLNICCFLTKFHFTQNGLEEESLFGNHLGDRMASIKGQVPMEKGEDSPCPTMQMRRCQGLVAHAAVIVIGY